MEIRNKPGGGEASPDASGYYHVKRSNEQEQKIMKRAAKSTDCCTPPAPLDGGNPELSADAGEVQIREMVEGDIQAVVEIEKKGQFSPWSERQFLNEINSIDVSRPIVAMIDKRLVGFAVPWYVMDEIELSNIGVDTRFRRQGVASKLMQCIFQEVERGEFRRIHLEVRRSNRGAIAFYRKFGFRKIGIRSLYYSDTGEDALLMVCDLDNTSIRKN